MSMIGEQFYLAAYWGPRAEGVEACAERLLQCVEDLRSLSDVMSSWFRKGASRSAKLAIAWEPSAVVGLLRAGQNRKDSGGEVMDELGYRVGLWNGNVSAPVSMSVTCGANPRTPGVMNAFVLQLPELELGGPDVAGLYGGGRLRSGLRSVVECWDPDWAVVTSNSLRNAQGPLPRAPHVGWLTYLSGQIPILENVPHGVLAESLRDGVLISSTQNPQDVNEEIVMAVRNVLARAGSLEPTAAS